MKEASGELSMTAVAAIAIGAIAVIFTTLILPALKTNIQRSTLCAQAYDCVTDGAKDGWANCTYLNENNEEKPITCKYDEADLTVK